jgi:DNA helicase-2/ATP-dependent DNA helicase PcrA
VFVLNAVDGCIPSDLSTGSSAEIEEERRLLYVAMTRAKDELTLMLPQRFYTHNQSRNGDRHLYAMRTRFVPPPILKLFETAVWPEPKMQDTAAKPSPRPQVDLRARVKGMWG